MKRKTRMYEPWGYQDENNYESAEIIHDNDLASFFADVSYNKDDNKIHFDNKDGEEVGTLDVSEFLKSDSIVDRAWYENGKIYIKFTNGDVITINVEELIDQNEFAAGLQVNDGIVSVLINAESDDYISVDTDGIKLTGVKADIEAEEARAISAETALDEKIESEIARATAEEQRIDGKLDQEIADRIADVDAEETRATEEETTIKNTIGGGFSTASTETVTAKFNALATALDTEIGNRTTQDNQLQNNINTESTARQAADTRLENLITDERNRAASEEQRIEAKLDQEITDRKADVDEEEARAISAETALDAKIDQEINDRIADVDAEETRAKAEETVLTNALNAEIARASAAEDDLDEKIGQEIADRTADVDAEEARAISAETALQEAIAAEQTRAEGAESDLQAAIEAEGQRAQDAEAALDTKIDGIESALTDAIETEKARAEAAEADLQDAIDQEILDRKAEAVASAEYVKDDVKIYLKNGNGETLSEINCNDFIVDGMIEDVELVESGNTSVLVITWNTDAGEKVTRIDVGDIFEADNYYTKADIDSTVHTLNNTIDAEQARAEGAERGLSESIVNEVTRAQTAEGNLQTAINGEATARADADTALQGAIDAEEARATSAETGLQTAIAAEKDRAEAAEALKANSADVYTKGEIDGKENALQAGIDANAAAIAAEETARIAADEAQDAIISTKADASAVTESIEAEEARALSAETDLQAAIDLKADKETTYTQEEVDALIAEKEAEIVQIKKDYNSLKEIVGELGGNVEWGVPADGTFNNMMKKSGTVKLGEDTTTSTYTGGITSKNETTLHLNGKNLTFSGSTTNNPGIMTRGEQKLTIMGKGTFDAAGRIAVEANGADTVINLSGTTGFFAAEPTYVTDRSGGELIYCYLGTINISAGVFKNNGDDKTFLLNCYDANYTAGTANIVVTGGKFYDFDPSNAMSEPGAPVSYLAPGYHVETSTVVEEGVEHTVYTVKKDA